MPPMNRDVEELRMDSPRPETPEPATRQGRRNGVEGVQLLDDDGAISVQLESCLKHIFAKYCTPRPTSAQKGVGLQSPPEGAYLSQEGLDTWARDTNGTPFDEATKEELMEFLDVTEDGGLTLKGFMQVYQLQTENDEEETWRDLSSHGFDRTLRLVATRREDMDTDGRNTPAMPQSAGKRHKLMKTEAISDTHEHEKTRIRARDRRLSQR